MCFWPVLFLAYNLFAPIWILPSWCHHLKTTIKAILSCSYQLRVSVTMLHSNAILLSHKKWFKKHIIALTIFSTRGKKKEICGKKKIQHDKLVPTMASWHYPPDGTILMCPSRCYQRNATDTMLPTKHYHQYATVLMLPLQHDSPEISLLKLQSSYFLLLPSFYCLDAGFSMPLAWN